jgi:hypothetical protein
MCPKQVISICGDSGVGKQTLIEAIDARSKEILDRFAIGESFSLHSSSPETRIAKTKLHSLDQMYQLPSAETIIFRWQFRDHAHIQKLLREFPEARHRVILLRRPWRSHARTVLGDKADDEIAMERTVSKLRLSWKTFFYSQFGPESYASRKGVQIELVDGNSPTYPQIADWNLREEAEKIESPSPSGNA